MQVIAVHDIPEIYSAYSMNLGRRYEGNTLFSSSLYYCNKCKTRFIAAFRYAGWLSGNNGFNDSIVYCSNCGHRHENWWKGPSSMYVFSDTDEMAPVSINLQVKEGKEILVLRARIKVLRFCEQQNEIMHRVMENTRIEEFRFDIKNRKAEFILRGNKGTVITERFEIGTPFNAPIFKQSMLSHIRSDNLSRSYGKGASGIIKTLRDRMRKKWQEIHGYDIGSLFVSYGKAHGRMLFPLLNLAYRLTYADAGNLPGYLSGHSWDVSPELDNRVLSIEAQKKFSNLEAIRNSRDSITAVIELFGLPDKPLIRKMLTEDIFSAAELAEICKVTKDINRVEAIWNVMRSKPAYDVPRYRSENALKAVYGLLQEMAQHYPERSVLAYLKRSRMADLVDTYNMLKRLIASRREAIWKVKPKDLHDALVQALKHQREEGFGLEVPEHVKKRLCMQLGLLKFFLPEHSKELMQIGDTLHNCVRTYDERMLAGESYIVPVTDDTGKLVACLEVKGEKLVQAKLKYNAPVYRDENLNREVLAWAEKVKLKISTSDVRVVERLQKAG